MIEKLLEKFELETDEAVGRGLLNGSQHLGTLRITAGMLYYLLYQIIFQEYGRGGTDSYFSRA